MDWSVAVGLVGIVAMIAIAGLTWVEMRSDLRDWDGE